MPNRRRGDCEGGWRANISQMRRKPIRLPGYDYGTPGAYFVTVCAHNGVRLFGEVERDEMQTNENGRVVEDCWKDIPRHVRHVRIDAFVVMPNHLHGIVLLVGARHASPLHVAIGSFKAATTRRINERRGRSGARVWQRGYYEHVVRDDDELQAIRQYIADNPLKWALDSENPAVRQRSTARRS